MCPGASERNPAPAYCPRCTEQHGTTSPGWQGSPPEAGLKTHKLLNGTPVMFTCMSFASLLGPGHDTGSGHYQPRQGAMDKVVSLVIWLHSTAKHSRADRVETYLGQAVVTGVVKYGALW